MAIVSLAPAVPEVEKFYADLIVAGDNPVGDLLACGFPCASVTTSAWQCAAPPGGLGHTACAFALEFAPSAAIAPVSTAHASTGAARTLRRRVLPFT